MARPGKGVAFVVLAVIGLALAGTIVAVVNPEIERTLSAVERVRRLRQKDTEVSLLLVRVRQNLVVNYDPLVSDVEAIERETADLRRVGAAAQARADRALATATAAVISAVENKLEIVEDFKSSFAVLRNSVALLSMHARDLGALYPRTPGELETHRCATVLLLDLSRLLMDGSGEHARRIQQDSAALRDTELDSGAIHDLAQKVLAQVEIARRARAQADGQVIEFLAVPVAAKLDALNALCKLRLERVDLRRRWFELGLEVVAASSLVIAALGVRDQRRARASLEQRVAERTRELATANTTLTQAGRAKSAFLANMSHEIRTPLTSILGFADLLDDERTPPEERREIARVIRRNGEHLLAILSDILDIAKIEAGKLSIESIAFSPRQIGEDVCALMRNRAETKQIELRLELAATGLPQQIHSDPTRLRQILVNLVGNAIKFTEQGAVTLTVGVEARADGPWLRLAVNDTGMGMSPDVVGRIFTDFEQGDSSTTRRFGGTGLGLSICRRLTGILGGELTVRSEPGVGSTFVVLLPCRNARFAAGPEATDVPAPAAPPAAPVARPGLRILVADDAAEIRFLVKRFLADVTTDVSVVCNGREAVDSALAAEDDKRPFDLILMDLHMPVLDGPEAVLALRAAGLTVPIVALTASVYTEDRERCARVGYTDFLTKPVNRPQLLHKVLTLVEGGDAARADAPAA